MYIMTSCKCSAFLIHEWSTGNTEPEIVKLYSAREEYSLPDLTVGSWSALVDRFVRRLTWNARLNLIYRLRCPKLRLIILPMSWSESWLFYGFLVSAVVTLRTWHQGCRNWQLGRIIIKNALMASGFSDLLNFNLDFPMNYDSYCDFTCSHHRLLACRPKVK